MELINYYLSNELFSADTILVFKNKPYTQRYKSREEAIEAVKVADYNAMYHFVEDRLSFTKALINNSSYHGLSMLFFAAYKECKHIRTFLGPTLYSYLTDVIYLFEQMSKEGYNTAKRYKEHAEYLKSFVIKYLQNSEGN